ncbi:hypothetical protein H6F48_08635 [Limnothrix sp. FACHB-1088]|uniref:hypothetical protein n=1 Tax=Limnothrix sp. FACHB-1088 TaxID=2692816 RepID=UPI0019B22C17|nr:hypothetical protein [Limnothrix sp. FACHB-1088]MBD2191858.1 hypothetical protein [Limnothrix sp. FACHB-1088]
MAGRLRSGFGHLRQFQQPLKPFEATQGGFSDARTGRSGGDRVMLQGRSITG